MSYDDLKVYFSFLLNFLPFVLLPVMLAYLVHRLSNGGISMNASAQSKTVERQRSLKFGLGVGIGAGLVFLIVGVVALVLFIAAIIWWLRTSFGVISYG